MTMIYADDVGIDYEIDWFLVGYTDASFVREQVK